MKQIDKIIKIIAVENRRISPMVFVCLFLTICTLNALTLAATKNNHSSQNDILLTTSPIGDASKQLWKSRIAASIDENDTSKNELQKLIDQINSVEFEGFEFETTLNIPSEIDIVGVLKTGPVKEPQTIETIVPEIAETKTPKKTIAPANLKDISKETLDIFKKLSEKPEQLDSPAALAEILFHSKCLAQAANCYQEWLSRLEKQEASRSEDKAWAMFQIGNCLAKDKPEKAIESYNNLIGSYPDSVLSEIAKAKNKLIDWQIKNNPSDLLKRSPLE